MAIQTKTEAWFRQRLALERGLYSPTGPVSRYLAGQPFEKSQRPNAFGREGTLSKLANKLAEQHIGAATKQTLLDALGKSGEKLGKKQSVVADVDSTCFEDLRWRNGIATATFYRGGDIVYDYPISLSEFLDWCSGSLGEYFNAEVRE
jgi:hypothetical protein